MSTHSPSLWKILSQTWRIITAHPRHFLALSVLFLLPVSLSAMVYTFLLQPTSLHSHYLQSLFVIPTPDPQIPPSPKPHLLISLLYILSLLLYSLCANSSITYSTFTAFYDEPVKFIPSLKSITSSFFPLLATLLTKQIMLGSIIFAFGVLMLVAYNGLALLGLETDYSSRFFLIFVIVISVILGLALVYLQVGWCLSGAVVVLESKWGFESLRRSSYLVKGARSVVLSVMVLFGCFGGILTTWYSNLVANNAGGVSTGWVFVQMVAYVVFSTVLSLYGLVANTVLFVYCKESHGEMGLLIDENGKEYITLATHGNCVIL
ncbi:hypothetical protein OROHE_001940 [Orobanche hederae]